MFWAQCATWCPRIEGITGCQFYFLYSAVSSSFKPCGPMAESKPQIKHFTAFVLGKAHPLTTSLTALALLPQFLRKGQNSLKIQGLPGSYSLLSGLKGVNSIVSVTGSHISGRRLSTPEQNQRRPSKPVQRSKRSESASTFEEEAARLRAYMASRHDHIFLLLI